LLAVPDGLLMPLYGELVRIRQQYGYAHEIHFSELASSRPQDSPGWQTANAWLRLFFEHALTQVKFKSFVVDFHHAEFDSGRYRTRRQAYRRFAITVAKSLAAWSFRDIALVRFTPFTDAGSPAASWLRRDGTLFSKFDKYVEGECRRAKQAGKDFYPEVHFAHALRPVPSSPSTCDQAAADEAGLPLQQLRVAAEFIQLADLITGCVQASLVLKVANTGKQQLAESFARTLASNYELPWHLAVRRARCMSVSMFPGTGRLPYSISLSGVRTLGMELLRTDETLREQYLTKYGFRLDGVGIGQGSLRI
jgi:hypothetical protein